MHGVFNKKFPQWIYSVALGVQVVLGYIKSDWAVSKELSMNDLAYRLVTWLALTSASRASTLQGQNVRFMTAHCYYLFIYLFIYSWPVKISKK